MRPDAKDGLGPTWGEGDVESALLWAWLARMQTRLMGDPCPTHRLGPHPPLCVCGRPASGPTGMTEAVREPGGAWGDLKYSENLRQRGARSAWPPWTLSARHSYSQACPLE